MSKKPEAEKRRVAFESALNTLVYRKPLSEEETDLILSILFDIQNGHDARQLLGIKSRRGPRVDENQTQGEMSISVHYWVLRVQAKMLAKVAAAEVARHWKMSPLRVHKIARKHRAWARSVVASGASRHDMDLRKLSELDARSMRVRDA